MEYLEIQQSNVFVIANNQQWRWRITDATIDIRLRLEEWLNQTLK